MRSGFGPARAELPGCSFVKASAYEVPFEDGRFDHVCCATWFTTWKSRSVCSTRRFPGRVVCRSDASHVALRVDVHYGIVTGFLGGRRRVHPSRRGAECDRAVPAVSGVGHQSHRLGHVRQLPHPEIRGRRSTDDASDRMRSNRRCRRVLSERTIDGSLSVGPCLETAGRRTTQTGELRPVVSGISVQDHAARRQYQRSLRVQRSGDVRLELPSRSFSLEPAVFLGNEQRDALPARRHCAGSGARAEPGDTRGSASGGSNGAALHPARRPTTR